MSAQVRTLMARAGEMALYGGANLIRPALALLTLPLYALLFTPEDFGVIGIFTAILGLLVITFPLNGQIYVLWNRAQLGMERSAAAVGATVRIATIASAITGAVGLVGWMAFDPEFAPAWIIPLAAIAAWATVWIMLDLFVHQADEQAGAFFGLNLGWAIIGPVATLLLAAFVVQDWTARVGGIAIAAAITAVWSGYSLRRRRAVSIHNAGEQIGPVVRFGVPLLPHTLGIWAASFVDRFIVAAFVDIAATGIYTVAFSIALGVGAAHDGVSRFFAPRLAKLTNDGSNHALTKASQFAFGYSVIALASIPLVWLIVATMSQWLLPAEYDSVTDFIPWLVTAQALIGIARVFTGYLYAKGWTGFQSVVTIVSAAVGIGVAFAAVPSVGVLGAAYAAVVGGAVRAVLTLGAAYRTGYLRSPLSGTKDVSADQ